MNKAFTLIELAIVIVILGLITVGVLGAQSLIESTKQRSLASDYSMYQVAIKAFVLEYDALPGDFNDAYAYWGSKCGSNAITTSSTLSSGINNCNGNGNRIYERDAEGLKFWQHLSLAKIIPGNYTGIHTGTWGRGDCCLSIGINSPKTAYDKTTFWLRQTGDTGVARSETSFRVGIIPNSGWHRWAWEPFFTAAEAKSFDNKIDDGNGRTGLIRGIYANCTSGNDYNVSSGNCGLQILVN
jgi:prepilin-type N-terminal cleavage/methylation domain-containing protein